MGIIVFIFFCLFALIVVCAIIGAKGQPAKSHGARQVCYDEYDEDESFDSGEFYVGIPFGDGRIVMTDDDDFIDEFRDEVL